MPNPSPHEPEREVQKPEENMQLGLPVFDMQALEESLRAVVQGENAGSVLASFNIDAKVLNNAFKNIIDDCLDRREYEFALRAAQVSKAPNHFKMILEALEKYPKITDLSVRNAEGEFGTYVFFAQQVAEALLGTQDEVRIRPYAVDKERQQQLNEAAEAYSIIGDHEKAAELYLILDKKWGRVEDYTQAGVELFKAGQTEKAQQVAINLLVHQHWSEGVELGQLTGLELDLSTLIDVHAKFLKNRVQCVGDAIRCYLAEKRGVDPFPLKDPQWARENQDAEWSEYRDRVENISGDGRPQVQWWSTPLAKPLYASIQYRSSIGAIRTSLQRHMLIGCLLSSLTREANASLDGEPSEYPGELGFRTYDVAFHSEYYNPFHCMIAMREDEHAIAVEKLMESFREETRFCMEDEDTWCHTTRSREYRRENIHLIRQKVEAIYF
ncbi:MAG: hypothetical protein KDD60_11675, partial [Bdellovibrionales bacterium]|nr:hypothetical protein [Bdellovibrionales bacterium]